MCKLHARRYKFFVPSYYKIFIMFKISKIKIGRQNRNSFHRVCLHIVTNFNYFLVIFIVQSFTLFIFTYKVSFTRIGKSVEVRGNGESLDAIFKDHIL